MPLNEPKLYTTFFTCTTVYEEWSAYLSGITDRIETNEVFVNIFNSILPHHSFLHQFSCYQNNKIKFLAKLRFEIASIAQKFTNLFCFPFEHCGLIGNTNFHEVNIWVESFWHSRLEFLQTSQKLNLYHEHYHKILSSLAKQIAIMLYLQKFFFGWDWSIMFNPKNVVGYTCCLT